MLRHGVIYGAVGLTMMVVLLTLPRDIALPLVLLAPGGVGFFSANAARFTGVARTRLDVAAAGALASAVLALLAFTAVTVFQPMIAGVRGGTTWSLIGLLIVLGGPGAVGAGIGALVHLRRETVIIGVVGVIVVLLALLLSRALNFAPLVYALYVPPIPAALLATWLARRAGFRHWRAFAEGIAGGMIAGFVSAGALIGSVLVGSQGVGTSAIYVVFALEMLLLALICIIPAAMGLRLAELRPAAKHGSVVEASSESETPRSEGAGEGESIR